MQTYIITNPVFVSKCNVQTSLHKCLSLLFNYCLITLSQCFLMLPVHINAHTVCTHIHVCMCMHTHTIFVFQLHKQNETFIKNSGLPNTI